MKKHDESLELGILLGLDIPTALVISEVEDNDEDKEPEPQNEPSGSRATPFFVFFFLVAVGSLCLWLLSR